MLLAIAVTIIFLEILFAILNWLHGQSPSHSLEPSVLFVMLVAIQAGVGLFTCTLRIRNLEMKLGECELKIQAMSAPTAKL